MAKYKIVSLEEHLKQYKKYYCKHSSGCRNCPLCSLKQNYHYNVCLITHLLTRLSADKCKLFDVLQDGI
jgi:hypothetical protein